MKTIIHLIIYSLIITGCRYKEGPLISFKSVDNRILGYWEITELTCEGVDSLEHYYNFFGSDAKMKLYKEYHDALSYKINVEGSSFGLSGNFDFSKNKNIMLVNLDIGYQYWGVGPLGSPKKSEWEILRLTKHYFKVTIDFNGKNYIISCEKTAI